MLQGLKRKQFNWPYKHPIKIFPKS